MLTDDHSVPITKDWETDDNGIRLALWNAMEPNILTTVVSLPTTRGFWEHLQSTCSGKTSMAHIYPVSQAYSRCEQGDSGLTKYYTRFKKVYDELKQLFPDSPDPTVHEERVKRSLLFISFLEACLHSILLHDRCFLYTVLSCSYLHIISCARCSRSRLRLHLPLLRALHLLLPAREPRVMDLLMGKEEERVPAPTLILLTLTFLFKLQGGRFNVIAVKSGAITSITAQTAPKKAQVLRSRFTLLVLSVLFLLQSSQLRVLLQQT